MGAPRVGRGRPLAAAALAVAVSAWAGMQAVAAPAVPAGGGQAAWATLQGRLSALSGQQRRTLSALAALGQAVAQAQASAQAARAAAARAQAALAEAERRQAQLEAQAKAQVAETVRLLRVMEYLGPVSPLEVVVGAASWRQWVGGMDALTVAVGRVGASLDRLRALAASERKAVADRQRALAAADAALARAAAAQQRLEAAQGALAARLQALGRERQFYAGELSALLTAWRALAASELTRLQAALTQLAGMAAQVPGMTTSLGGQGMVTVTLPVNGINQALKAETGLAGISLAAGPGGELALLDAPHGVAITTSPQVAGPTVLALRVQAVAVDGVQLSWPAGAPAAATQLAVDLAPLLGAGRLRGVQVQGGALVVDVEMGGGFPFFD